MIWVMIAAAAVTVFFILPMFVLGGVLYTVLLVRTKPEKWGRTISFPDDPEYVVLFDEALEWGRKWEEYKSFVSIENDGFRLVGEYFDFGGDSAVIIVPGRTESLLYSYFYAEPYRASGYNVLVIDNRSHGLSEGKYSSLGFKEYRDLIAWASFLSDNFFISKVILHGICIGSSASLFALTDPSCPPCLAGMVADGMYTTFYESFKCHIKDMGRKNFPITYIVMLYIRLFSGANVVTDGPIKRMPLLEKPILFLHSRQDVFSLPEKATELYELCRSDKRIVWFDKGDHSRIRINDHEGYDAAVTDFLKTFA